MGRYEAIEKRKKSRQKVRTLIHLELDKKKKPDERKAGDFVVMTMTKMKD